MLPVTVMAGRTTDLPNLDNYTSRGGSMGLGHRDLVKLPAAILIPWRHRSKRTSHFP